MTDTDRQYVIGDWIRRRKGKWHLCESVVAGDAFTRCGRRMDRVTTGGELQVSGVMPLTRMIGQPQLCKAGCDAGNAETPSFASAAFGGEFIEDDGSTHDETVP